jgi:hypothetical protein
VVSWRGIGSFADNALFHIRNVCEQNDFKFTVYYESTSGISNTLLDNYGDRSSWYRIDDRPVIYVYGRASDQLNPYMLWNIGGDPAFWSFSGDVREPPIIYGIFVIHPYSNGTRYVERNLIALPPNENTGWETLDDLVVDFNDCWLDLNYDISSYAGPTVSVRVESYVGGAMEWCSEWAAVDCFYVINSKGEIINESPYFDNEWETVVNSLNKLGYNPYFIMDFGGYEWEVQDFAEYVAFYNVTTGDEIANGSWNGYQGDWHNISFNASFTLEAAKDTTTPS